MFVCSARSQAAFIMLLCNNHVLCSFIMCCPKSSIVPLDTLVCFARMQYSPMGGCYLFDHFKITMQSLVQYTAASIIWQPALVTCQHELSASISYQPLKLLVQIISYLSHFIVLIHFPLYQSLTR